MTFVIVGSVQIFSHFPLNDFKFHCHFYFPLGSKEYEMDIQEQYILEISLIHSHLLYKYNWPGRYLFLLQMLIKQHLIIWVWVSGNIGYCVIWDSIVFSLGLYRI